MIRLNSCALETKRRELKWTKTKLAQRIGVSSTSLYRAGLDPQDKQYNKPGEKMITGILTAFPGATFEEFFYLD